MLSLASQALSFSSAPAVNAGRTMRAAADPSMFGANYTPEETEKILENQAAAFKGDTAAESGGSVPASSPAAAAASGRGRAVESGRGSVQASSPGHAAASDLSHATTGPGGLVQVDAPSCLARLAEISTRPPAAPQDAEERLRQPAARQPAVGRSPAQQRLAPPRRSALPRRGPCACAYASCASCAPCAPSCPFCRPCCACASCASCASWLPHRRQLRWPRHPPAHCSRHPPAHCSRHWCPHSPCRLRLPPAQLPCRLPAPSSSASARRARPRTRGGEYADGCELSPDYYQLVLCALNSI